MERYEIRRKDNDLCYYTRTNRKDAIEIREQIQRITGIEHYIFDTKKQAIIEI